MINRIFPHFDGLFIALYYALLYLTPANLRGAGRTIADCGLRIADWRANRTALRSSLAAGVLVLLAVPMSFAQTPAAADTTAPSAALSAELLKLRDEGNAALYNIDYAGARAKFEEVRKRLPQHPAGDLYLGITVWLEHLNRSRRLQTSLYRENSSFYAGADKADESTEGDTVDPAVDRAFRDRLAQAKIKALSLVNRNKQDADALYFLGAVHGVLAGYEASTARKFFSAMRNGSRGVDLHQKVIQLKPDYYDAYLSIGMYHYVVGNLPFAVKALAAIAGIRGNKNKGIAELQTVIDKGAANADDARVMLLAIYQNEKRPTDALAQLQHLSEKYPRSYLVRIETAVTLAELKRSAEAGAAFEALIKDPTAAPALDLVHYQYAEALTADKEFARAADQFLAAARVKEAEANLVTVALLRAAQVYDLAGQRNQALAQYKAVLARPNVYDTREQAERGIKQPYLDKDKDKKSA